ncbi:MAG TPA: response regulator [Propionibacteriaceae bacterium]|nr:response regulator [Propionibacteriaceae bacterium]
MISVVVIDDDFRVAKIHSSFVARVEGYEVVGVAHSGADALSLVRNVEPDLMLLDLYLPDIFGLDLLNQMRVGGLICDVIVISAGNESKTVQQAVQLGVTNYLLKPFTFADLQQRLDDYRLHRTASHPYRLGDQSEIDRLFGRTGRSMLEQLPKGMSPETATLILSKVADSASGVSALECAEIVGISRVSARRYLEHYTTKGLMSVTLRYGNAGRPERRYTMVKSQPNA